MRRSRQLIKAYVLGVLALLACSTRAFGQSPQTGNCASCTAVDSSGICSSGLPVCVDTSSGSNNNLPCSELIAGGEAAYGSHMAATIQQNVLNSMPEWMRANQPAAPDTASQAPVPSDADLAAKQCPAEKPSKMCCGVKAFAGTAGSPGQPGQGGAGGAAGLGGQPGQPGQPARIDTTTPGTTNIGDVVKQNGAGSAAGASAVVAGAVVAAVVLLQML